MATDYSDKPIQMSDEPYWNEGQLVAHIAGGSAGNLRLDIQIDEMATAEIAADRVTLVIPGELSPLTPTGAIGEKGRYVISYFSSDVSNAGKLPSEAVVHWSTETEPNQERRVKITSATKVSLGQGPAAANLPEALTNRSYPTAVAMVALAGAICASIAIAATLLWSS